MNKADRRRVFWLWAGGMTHRQLAALYRVNRTTVREVVAQTLARKIRAQQVRLGYADG